MLVHTNQNSLQKVEIADVIRIHIHKLICDVISQTIGI